MDPTIFTYQVRLKFLNPHQSILPDLFPAKLVHT